MILSKETYNNLIDLYIENLFNFLTNTYEYELDNNLDFIKILYLFKEGTLTIKDLKINKVDLFKIKKSKINESFNLYEKLNILIIINDNLHLTLSDKETLNDINGNCIVYIEKDNFNEFKKEFDLMINKKVEEKKINLLFEKIELEKRIKEIEKELKDYNLILK